MKKISLVFSLVVAVLMHSQTIKGKIQSATSNKPIEFAKIGILGEEIGAITDQKGNFTLDFKNTSADRIVMVSVAGYETYKEKLGDFLKLKPYEIRLQVKSVEIEEVKITPKSFKEKNWGINTHSKSVLYSISKRDSSNLKEAVIEFNSKKRFKINKVNLNIARMEIEEPVDVRIVIYNEKNGAPGEMILQSEIIRKFSANEIKDETFSIDTSHESLWMKGKIFVGFQFVGDVKGFIFISGALFKTGYVRKFYNNWTKHTIAAPAINIDVKVEK